MAWACLLECTPCAMRFDLGPCSASQANVEIIRKQPNHEGVRKLAGIHGSSGMGLYVRLRAEELRLCQKILAEQKMSWQGLEPLTGRSMVHGKELTHGGVGKLAGIHCGSGMSLRVRLSLGAEFLCL